MKRVEWNKQAEDALKEIGFQKLSIFRPKFLFGRNDDSRPLEKWSSFLAPSFLGVDIQQVGLAMRKNAVENGNKDGVEIIENSAIKAFCDW